MKSLKTELLKFRSLLKRNIKMYFADKTIFFMSLLAPMILLMLFILFLRKVYDNSLLNSLPQGFSFADEKLTSAFVAGWLISSLMSVSCVTVSIGACVVMVQDKIKGVIQDIDASPIGKGTISFAYFAATFVSALIIVFITLIFGFIYIAVSGWYLTAADVLLILLNTILLTLFGCALAIIVNQFINSDGGVTAVAAMSSSVYGFISGAYMPLKQFGKVFSNIFGFNPGLYGAMLYKKLFLGSVLNEMSNSLPSAIVDKIKDGFDFNFYFFDNLVSPAVMLAVLACSVVLLSGIIILITNRKNIFRRKKAL